MPRKRQPDGIRIRTFGATFSGRTVVPPHSRDWDQLIYASKGVMSVHTSAGLWVVPPLRAVWVPAKLEYRVEMAGPVSLRTLYLVAGSARSMPKHCCTVNVSPLLRELILHTMKLSTLDRAVPTQARLIGVILDQLRMLPAIPLQLAAPRDPRAQAAARELERNPADPRSLTELARQCGASPRTLERLFLNETSMTLGRWRQRLRVLHSLRLLSQGESVTAAALAVGYSSVSSFIAMFKNELGTTPSRYYET